LRRRAEDVIPLARFFIKKYAQQNQRPALHLSEGAENFLLAYDWPGNVRELENAMERVVVLSYRELVSEEDLDFLTEHRKPETVLADFNFIGGVSEQQKILPIEEMTQKYIQYVLAVNKGAKNKTARELGIDRKTLYRKLHVQ
jgi:DNA-binding NtrC family response regulator